MMALLPKVKLKALPNFPSNTTAGAGIAIEKVSGNYTVSLDVSDFQRAVINSSEGDSQYIVGFGRETTDNPDGEFTLVPFSSVQSASDELSSLAGLSLTGGVYRIGSASYTVRTLTAGTGLGVTNGDGVSGNPTIAITDAELLALAGLSSAANKLPYFTGSGAASLADFTAFARSLVDDADAAAARTTLGLTSAATATPSALTKTDDTNVTLTLGGTPATALLQATSITVGWTGTLALSRLAQGTDGQLIVGQTSASPLYKTISGDWTLSAAGAATLATVNSNVGAFGSATQSVQFTVNGKGLITAAANVTVTPDVGSITGLASGIAAWLADPTSAKLRTALTDESGTGSAIFAGGNIGAATATSINGNTFTTGTYTLTGGAGKTFTFSNTLTFTGTDGTSFAFPSGSDTVATLGQAQTFTGGKHWLSGTFILDGSTSGSLLIKPAATAGSNTLTLPAGTTDFSATGGTSQVVKQTSAGGAFTVGQLAFTDISSSVAASQLPNPSASTLGGIQSYAAVSNQWIRSISTSGVPASSQPAFTDISGSVAASQMPALTGDITTSAGAVATTLATVASAGTTGSSTATPVVTIDAKGRTTSVTSVPTSPYRAVAVTTVSSVSTLDIAVPSGGGIIRLDYCNNATANQDLQMLFSTDGGSTYDTTTGNYKWANSYLTVGGVAGGLVSSGGGALPVLAHSQVATGGMSAEIYVKPTSHAGDYQAWRWNATYQDSTTAQQTITGGGFYQVTTAITHVRFKYVSGNIAQVTYTVTGLQ